MFEIIRSFHKQSLIVSIDTEISMAMIVSNVRPRTMRLWWLHNSTFSNTTRWMVFSVTDGAFPDPYTESFIFVIMNPCRRIWSVWHSKSILVFLYKPLLLTADPRFEVRVCYGLLIDELWWKVWCLYEKVRVLTAMAMNCCICIQYVFMNSVVLYLLCRTLFILTLCIYVYFASVDHVDIRLQNLIVLGLANYHDCAFCNYSLQLKISSVLVW